MTISSPPTVPGKPFVGSAPAILADPLGFIAEQIAQHDGVFTFTAGPTRVHVVHKPEDLYQVLVKEARIYHKRDKTKRALSPLLGNGLLLSDGDFWRRQRRMAQPAFHRRSIAAYADIMAQYTEELIADWHPGDIYDMHERMMFLALRIVSKTLLNVDASQDAGDVIHILDELLPLANTQTRQPIVLPGWLPTRPNLTIKRGARRIDAMVYRFIDERRTNPSSMGDDLLSMLIRATDEETGEGMSDHQLRDEVMNIFLAGHETTANNLAWTWYLLDQYPEVEAKLHEELDRVLGERQPTVEDLPKLPYTARIVKEALRLYPSAWAIARQPVEDTELGGYAINAGDSLLIPLYHVHRNPEHFEDPERFDPDRFLPERQAALPRMAYLPFSTGPRVCIGESFALMEARMVIATMAQRFRYRLHPDQVVEPGVSITLKPKHGLFMTVEARQG